MRFINTDRNRPSSHVLLVRKHTSFQHGLAEALIQNGFESACTVTAAEAIEFARQYAELFAALRKAVANLAMTKQYFKDKELARLAARN